MTRATNRSQGRGWLPWGALAPFLCFVLVALPDLAATLMLWPFHLVDANGNPIGTLATIGLVGSHRIRTLLGIAAMLSGIARKLNVPIAVLLSSATFTLLHYDAKQHWATTATSVLFSIFACAWALRSGNVWGVMGWHPGWNWLLAVGFELPVMGPNANPPLLLLRSNPTGSVLMTGGAQGPEGSIWCNLFLLAAIAFMLWRGRGGYGRSSMMRTVTVAAIALALTAVAAAEPPV